MKPGLIAKAGTALCAALAFVFPYYTTAAEPQYDRHGAICRLPDRQTRPVYLVISADSLFEGGQKILETLDRHKVKASFFFTGNFLRRTENETVIRKIINSGHYVGGHSDRHILLCDWSDSRNTLITPDSLMSDLTHNFQELKRYGISIDSASVFLPPFEWHNSETVKIMQEYGLTPIALTPGILTYRDYTTPDMDEYRSSDEIIRQLFTYETQHGLDGAIIIIHAGTQPSRTDKLYSRLDEIIKALELKEYRFQRFMDNKNRQ